jgi:NADPH-dependent ferric siderophore reductase
MSDNSNENETVADDGAPRVVRHGPFPVQFRRVTVQRVERIAPRIQRVVVGGDTLEGFRSDGADDHVKVVFPTADGLHLPTPGPNGLAFAPGIATPPMRDYTPRHYDAARRELTLDFILHDAGPATAWAQQAQVGDVLGIGGPRGSQAVADVFDWYLLIGDETAMPAIGRRLEELSDDVHAIVLIEVDDEQDELPFVSRASIDVRYVHRRGASSETTTGTTTPLDDALHALDWPEGEGFVYIAGEAGMMRRLKEHVTGVRNHPREWMRASGYWKPGVSNHHD